MNAALAIPASMPTEPAELTRLLADALARRGAEAADPMRDWTAYAALALAEPGLELPKDFGSDLLPAERERVARLRDAFAAIGRALAASSSTPSSSTPSSSTPSSRASASSASSSGTGAGSVLDRALVEELALALAGAPRLAIPKIEFCTRVERFGRYTPCAGNRFLARSNARFIAYSELSGFTSALEDGQYVTRLATRISIESARDDIEVWARSPEWTPVVDSSPVRRDEFFLGEIVPLSEYLSVGAYRLRIEIRDEATGNVAVATQPLQIVADPAMAAVGD